MLEPPPEVPGFEVLPLSGLLGFEGFSTGVVTCSSSEPLSASVMQPVKNARLSVKMQAKIQWGG